MVMFCLRKGPTFTKVLFFVLIIHARKYRKRFFWEIIKIMGYYLVFLFVSSFAFMHLYHIHALLSSDPVPSINWHKAVFWLLAPCFTKKEPRENSRGSFVFRRYENWKSIFPVFLHLLSPMLKVRFLVLSSKKTLERPLIAGSQAIFLKKRSRSAKKLAQPHPASSCTEDFE